MTVINEYAKDGKKFLTTLECYFQDFEKIVGITFSVKSAFEIVRDVDIKAEIEKIISYRDPVFYSRYI